MIECKINNAYIEAGLQDLGFPTETFGDKFTIADPCLRQPGTSLRFGFTAKAQRHKVFGISSFMALF